MASLNKSMRESADYMEVRHRLYTLMSNVFMAEPSAEFLLELRTPERRQVFSDLGVDFGAEFVELDVEELQEQLAIEYTRLFLGPGQHISAHESVFVEVDGESGELWGARTVALKNFIAGTGLEYDAGFRGIPDHVSVELEFMARLVAWEIQMRENNNRADVHYSLKIQSRFMTEHLMTWVPDLCEEVAKTSNVSFYREMASLCADFLEEDWHLVKSSLLDLEQRIA